MRVLCLVTHPSLGAGNRLRVEQYAPLLAPMGIHLEVSAFLTERAYEVLYLPGHLWHKVAAVPSGLARRLWDVVRSRRYDMALIYRESAPVGPPLVERALRALGVPYVFDFDDSIFLPAFHPTNRRWAWLRPPGRFEETARHARAVIAGNEFLASYARRLNGNVDVLPTPVDTELHRPAPQSAVRSSPVVIGWIGSTTTAPYLRLVDEPLAALARKRDVAVHVVGGPYQNPGIPNLRVSGFELQREPQDLRGFDIGILPEPDDDWTRGKGAFKALLYMATGLPVVASAVGVNTDVVVHGVTGYCVNAPEEWEDALTRLAEDAELRQRMGRAGRERVERLFSLRVMAPRFASVLTAAASAA